ncbi:MAG TPA: hypothetical protein VF488_10705 [Gemmatimonadaceae bacterium]
MATMVRTARARFKCSVVRHLLAIAACCASNRETVQLMASDQDARSPSRGRRRYYPDLGVTVIRRAVDDPDAWRRLVEILADLLYEPDAPCDGAGAGAGS